MNFFATVAVGRNDAVVMLGFVMGLGFGLYVWMISTVVGWIRRLFDHE
jgi:hypothetical protein